MRTENNHNTKSGAGCAKIPVNFIVIFFVCLLFLSGCADTKHIEGTTYDTYGLINKDEVRNDAIKYRLVWGNVAWSVVLCETIVAPIYFIGFSMYEPVRTVREDDVKGAML